MIVPLNVDRPFVVAYGRITSPMSNPPEDHKLLLYKKMSEYVDHVRRHAAQEVQAALRGIDLPARDLEVIRFLYKHQTSETRFGDVVDHLERWAGEKINRSTVSQAITRLEYDDGLVKKRTVKKDQRKPIVLLTSKGLALGARLADAEDIVPINAGTSLDLDATESQALIKKLEHSMVNFDVLTEKVASKAGVYDYLIGGAHYTPQDREVARQVSKHLADAGESALANRSFLRRAVRYLAEQGITQFIDIGAGMPTTGHVHHVLDLMGVGYEVVYIDNDATAVNKSRVVLESLPRTHIVEEHFENMDRALTTDAFAGIDFEKPVAVLLIALLHFIENDDVILKQLAAIRQRLCPGSYIAISHGTYESKRRAEAVAVLEFYSKVVSTVRMRGRSEIMPFLEAMNAKLVPAQEHGTPQLVYAPAWRPDIVDPFLKDRELPFVDDPDMSMIWVGVGEIGGS